MSTGHEIILPYNFRPRGYQYGPWIALDSGMKRAITVWHRRSGKDITAMNYAIKCMFPHPKSVNGRIGTYYHLFPTYAQGKKIIWDGMTDEGVPYLNYFPETLFPLKKRNETELRLECINGSAYQIIGTDKLDAIVGTNQVACIFSEYSLQNPKAKDLILPILIQNKGWAWYIYTPRGRNHGWDLWRKNKGKPGWFTELRGIKNTLRDDGTQVITDADVQRAIEEGMDPDLARQEFHCSFDIGIAGSYYSNLLTQAEKLGRVGNVPHEVRLPVDTWWDIGVDDATAIWFTQQYGKEIRVIDYYEGSGEGLPYFAAVLQEKRVTRNYVYGAFNFPWDMEVRELSTGKTRIEQARMLGFKPARTVVRMAKEDGIAAVRATIPRCWWDYENCKEGFEALRNYHKQYDEKRRVYLNEPVHDWASHGADAFRTLAIGIREEITKNRPAKAETDFDVFTYHKQKNYDRPETAESDFDIFR